MEVHLSYGATEAKVPEIADAVVEVTETGSTLRKNGMQIIAVLLESSTQLVANRKSYEDPGQASGDRGDQDSAGRRAHREG